MKTLNCPLQDIFMARFFRTLSFLFVFAALFAANGVLAWEVVERNGVKYVSMSTVRSKYGFSSQKKEGAYWVYETPGRKIVLKLRSGSQDMFANGLKFVLSYPAYDDPTKGLLVSSMDVHKIINPIVVPSHIRQGKVVRTVIIDPGHGGHDCGARRYNLLEKDLNLAVAKRLKAFLQKSGLQVVMTRETDVFLTLQQRVQIANRYKDAVFISIHFNSGRPSACGLETFTLAPAGTSSAMSRYVRKGSLAGNAHDSANIALAAAVQGRMISFAPEKIRTKMDDRGIKRARFSVLCTINHPAILVECGFVSNAAESQLIKTDRYHQFVAGAIAEGVTAYRRALNKPGTIPSGGRTIAIAGTAR